MIPVPVTTRTRSSIFFFSFAFCTLLLLERTSLVVDAYITHTALPEQRQVEWLKEMTFEVCESPPGELSDEMLENTPHIIRGWATISKNSNINNKKRKSGNKKNIKKKMSINKNNDNNNDNSYNNKNNEINGKSIDKADFTANGTKGTTAVAANTAAAATTKNDGTEYAKAVESLMKRLIEEKRVVRTEDYNCLLEGWATSSAGEAAAERCEQILTTMQHQYCEDNDINVKPDLDSFKTSLMAWKNVALSQNNMSGGKKRKVEEYADRAQRMLEWMIQLYDDGHNDCALPDADCFDIVLKLWSKSGHVDAPQKTEQLLRAMGRIYVVTGNESIKPRTGSFNAVLAAEAKSSSSTTATVTAQQAGAERTLKLLAFMERLAAEGDTGVAPDLVSYTIVVNSLIRLGNEDGNKKAEALLERLINIYTTRSNDTNEKNEEEQQEQTEKVSKKYILSPDTSLFNAVMGGWSKSKTGSSSSFQRTRAILDQQIALYEIFGCKKCRPDVFGFTSVINNCANAGRKMNTNNKRGVRQHQHQIHQNNKFEAFQIASETFDQLRAYGRPNEVTYGAMMKACNLLLDKNSMTQKNLVHDIFNACIEDGCVGTMVLHHLHEIDPSLVNSWKKTKQK